MQSLAKPKPPNPWRSLKDHPKPPPKTSTSNCWPVAVFCFTCAASSIIWLKGGAVSLLLFFPSLCFFCFFFYLILFYFTFFFVLFCCILCRCIDLKFVILLCLLSFSFSSRFNFFSCFLFFVFVVLAMFLLFLFLVEGNAFETLLRSSFGRFGMVNFPQVVSGRFSF